MRHTTPRRTLLANDEGRPPATLGLVGGAVLS